MTDLRTGMESSKEEFTIEGIHMYANAFQVILNHMKPLSVRNV